MATLKKDAGLGNELTTNSEDSLDDSSEGSSSEEPSDDSADDRPAKRQKLEPSLELLEERRKTLEAKMRGQRSTNKEAMVMIRKRDGIISNLRTELKTKPKKDEDNTYRRKILEHNLKSAKKLTDEFNVANHHMSLEMQDLKNTIRQKYSQITDLVELGLQKDSEIANLKSTIDKMTQENNDVKQNVLRALGVDLDSK